MTALFIVAALWLTPAVLTTAWVLADRWLDSRMPVEGADAEWLAELAPDVDPHDDLIFQQLCFERWEQS